MKTKYLFTLFLFILFIPKSYGQIYTISDSARISLLTSSAWDKEVYALFGHTAIRINDKENKIDHVFNYGIFSFNSDNFMYKFVKGETDYILGVQDFEHYLQEYKERGVSVYEQVFNFTSQEKQKLCQALYINSLPQNREYRYNYFFDNCSTRARDMVENNISGTVVYTPTNKEQSLRDLVHACVSVQPWTEFGIDLVIGSDADTPATDREKMFLPEYLMNAYKGATITGQDGQKRLLISEEGYILQSVTPSNSSVPANYPLIAGIILMAFCAIISVLNFYNKTLVIGKIFDTVLFFVAGIAGCIIFFLMFISIHPCTIPNWNIIWLNPLQVVISFLFFIKKVSKFTYYYHFINFVALSLFLLGWYFIPQQLNIAFIPYILSIWVRSGTNFVQYRRRKLK